MGNLWSKNAVVVLGLIITIGGSPGIAGAGELVDILTKQLGVTKAQAEGGAGAIFSQVKKNLTVEEFAKVDRSIPGVAPLLEAAPAAEEAAGSIDSAAALAASFSTLGLDADMVGKFVPVVIEFGNAKGGYTVVNLLKRALPFP